MMITVQRVLSSADITSPRKNLEALFTYTRTEQLDHGTGAQFDYSVRRDVSYKDAYRAELIWFF